MSIVSRSLTAIGVLTDAMWIALAIAIVIAIVYLVRWLRSVYLLFTAPGGDTHENFINLFTPHQDDGGIAPKDVKPKGVDPIDWIFMDHDLSAPV